MAKKSKDTSDTLVLDKPKKAKQPTDSKAAAKAVKEKKLKNGLAKTEKKAKKESDATKIERRLKKKAKQTQVSDDAAESRQRLKDRTKLDDWQSSDSASTPIKQKKKKSPEEVEAKKRKKIDAHQDAETVSKKKSKDKKSKKVMKAKLEALYGSDSKKPKRDDNPKVKKDKDKKLKKTLKQLADDIAKLDIKLPNEKPSKRKSKLIVEEPKKLILPKKKRFMTADSILDFEGYQPEASDKDSRYSEEEEYDLSELIRGALKTHAPAPRDLKVDDQGLSLAKNFFEFSTSQDYMDQKPFVKQLEIAIKTFGEYNPLKTNMEWFADVPVDASYDDFLENVQLLEHGKCPKTGITKSELVRRKLLYPYTELAASLGQRSGKSFLAALMAAYITHGLLKLQKPSQAFGLAKGVSTFHGTFVSLTFKQAKENLYDPFHGLIAESKWFQEYHKILDYYGSKYGEELYKFKDTFLEYRPRDLIIYPSGPDKRVLRGRTRFISAIDEIGWIMSGSGIDAQSKSVKYNADEIHKALKNSQRTAVSGYLRLLRDDYYTVIPPMMINISSPSSKYDMITRLVERAKQSKTIIGFNKATWEFNPTIKQEDLEDEFREDPERAWRDFGAVPPLSSATFISDVENFVDVIDKTHHNAFSIDTIEIKNKKMKKTFTTGRLKNNWVDVSAPKCMCIDAGEVDNSFAVAIGHNVLNDDGEFIPVIDGLGEIFPSKERPVNFTYVEKDVLIPLIQQHGVTHVFADRWQSTKLLSDLEDKCGVYVDRYSLKYQDFNSFRDDLYAGGFIMPRPELKPPQVVKAGDKDYPSGFKDSPISHFIFQCLTVKDMSNKGVIKGDHATDDLFRAAVLLHKFLSDPEFREFFEGSILLKKDRGLGAMRSMFMGGSPGAIGGGKRIGQSVAMMSRGAAPPPGKLGAPKIFTRTQQSAR